MVHFVFSTIKKTEGKIFLLNYYYFGNIPFTLTTENLASALTYAISIKCNQI